MSHTRNATIILGKLNVLCRSPVKGQHASPEEIAFEMIVGELRRVAINDANRAIVDETLLSFIKSHKVVHFVQFIH